MRVYNTLGRKIEEFTPINDKEVKIYCCGPTVYDFPHIGNLRAFIFYDIIRRTLLYNGFRVKQIMNITDVDDKTIKNSKLRGMELSEYTKIYTDAFFEDLKKLNISEFEGYPRATQSIGAMETMITGLLSKGYAYKSNDGIYYSVSKFKDYGKLSGMSLKETKSRIQNDEYDKDSAADFALWKTWTPDDGDVYWENDLPKGRPGWSIECSAMVFKNLGESIDIHAGGIDLIFPHHENEIAQSEAFTGKRFVKYWLHSEHLLVNGKKMSKSLHNFYTLRDLEKLGFDVIAFRLLVLDSHYRSKINFTLDILKKYEKTLDDIDITLKSYEKLPKGNKKGHEEVISEILNEFKKSINNDFDTHEAIKNFFMLIELLNEDIKSGSTDNESSEAAMLAVQKMDSILGVIDRYSVPDEVIKLAEERSKLRDSNDWAGADLIRNKIKEKGFKVIDLFGSNYTIIKNRQHGN